MAPERQHFPNTTGEDAIRTRTHEDRQEYAGYLQKLKLHKAPGQRRGSGHKRPSAKKLFIIDS